MFAVMVEVAGGFYGPFASADDAAYYGKRYIGRAQWSIVSLQSVPTREWMEESDAKAKMERAAEEDLRQGRATANDVRREMPAGDLQLISSVRFPQTADELHEHDPVKAGEFIKTLQEEMEKK